MSAGDGEHSMARFASPHLLFPEPVQANQLAFLPQSARGVRVLLWPGVDLLLMIFSSVKLCARHMYFSAGGLSLATFVTSCVSVGPLETGNMAPCQLTGARSESRSRGLTVEESNSCRTRVELFVNVYGVDYIVPQAQEGRVNDLIKVLRSKRLSSHNQSITYGRQARLLKKPTRFVATDTYPSGCFSRCTFVVA